MVVYVRDSNRVLFVQESGTYASPSGASGNWIGLVTSHSPTESENIIEVRYAGTTSRNFGQLINGPKDYEGAITYHPQDFNMFAFALGSNVDSGSPSPYAHLISELNSDGRWAYTSGTSQLTNFPSFTIKDSKRSSAGDGTHMIRTFNGAVVDSISLTATQNEPVVCEVSYKAQGFVLGSKTTDILNIYNEDTSRPYIWSDTRFYLPSGAANVVNEVNEVVLNIENNVENRHYVNGSKVAQAMVPTMRNYSLDLTLDANSTWGKTLEDYHKNGSVFNALLELNISTGSEAGYFIMSGCKIMDFSAPSEVEGIDEFSISIKPQTLTISVDDLVEKYNPW